MHKIPGGQRESFQQSGPTFNSYMEHLYSLRVKTSIHRAQLRFRWFNLSHLNQSRDHCMQMFTVCEKAHGYLEATKLGGELAGLGGAGRIRVGLGGHVGERLV